MINYDYLIERNEGNDIVSYKPDLISSQLPDVVCIEGPNSSGKSTLLNLLAVGFHGLMHSSNEINPELKERITNLIESSYQKVKFEIEIKNDSLNETYILRKPNLDKPEVFLIKVQDGNEKPIPYSTFKKEYRLIYDIPNNPLARLRELLKDVETTILDYGNRITRLNNKLLKYIREVEQGQNKKRIDELYKTIESLQTRWNKKNSDIEARKQNVELLKKFCYIKFFLHYTNKKKKAEEQLNLIEKEEKKRKREYKSYTKAEETILREIKTERKHVLDLYNNLCDSLSMFISKSKHNHLNILIDSDCLAEINDPEANNSIRKEIISIKELLKQQLKQIDPKSEGEARLLQRIRSILEDFKGHDFKIPGTQYSIEEFMNEIDNVLTNYDTVIAQTDSLQKNIVILDEFDEQLQSVIKKVKQCRSIMKEFNRPDEQSDESGIKEQIEILDKNRKTADSKIKNYLKELALLNIDPDMAEKIYRHIIRENKIEAYKNTDESQLNKIIDDKLELIATETLNLKKIEGSINLARIEYKKVESSKPHKYQDYQNELENLRTPLQLLEQKVLKDFHGFLKELMDPSIRDVEDNNAEKKLFWNKVSEFLAYKIGYIRHVKKSYKVKSIDIVKEIIITQENRVIRFADLGTGQSQGAYLEGLLNIDDNRKLIALLDEVAMMDSTTLNPIYNKLKDLYDKKKLVCGVIVQKADKVNVKSIV